ncbi:biogenesis of lysosome-related organelles complex 1 subunit 5, partial [Phlebotomus papatasi]|uniref:biogenesis of lysosome-related organelles complex 1 subunit 5 n=1 Tax=Phlebotomus papatasi TaxID=29031 RepID=UPI0024841D25
MTARDIVKDIGEVYSRIFDHRPFTSAEIQYFVREFEEKRNDREVENLFLSLQNTSEAKDSGVSKCKVACEGHLDQLQKSLEVALTACQEVSN